VKRSPARRKGLLLLALLLLVVPFGLLLAQVATEGPLVRYDVEVTQNLHLYARATPAVVTIAKVFTFAGNSIVLYPILLAAVVHLAARQRFRGATFLAVTAIRAQLLSNVTKLVVGRPRPQFADPIAHGVGQSFPSGHALHAAAFYGALLLVFLPTIPRVARRPAVLATIVLVLGIGASRVVLGVHHVADVLAGFLLGSAWLCASIAWLTVETRREGEPDAVTAGGGDG